MLALWEGEGVPSEQFLLFLSNEMLPGGRRRYSQESSLERLGRVLKRGTGIPFPGGHPLGSRPTDPALL